VVYYKEEVIMIAEEMYRKAVENQYRILKEKINKAVENGEIYVVHKDELAKENVKKLTNEGFNVFTSSYGNKIDFK
jgi:regulator of replication initiation timing